MCVCCAGMQHSMLMTQETHPDMLNMIRLAHAMGTSAKEKKEHDKAMFTFGVASTALALEARNASLMTLDFVRKVDQKLDDLRTDFENGCFGSSASPEPKEPSASFDVRSLNDKTHEAIRTKAKHDPSQVFFGKESKQNLASWAQHQNLISKARDRARASQRGRETGGKVPEEDRAHLHPARHGIFDTARN